MSQSLQILIASPYAPCLAGLLIGAVFGAIVARTNFCAMGAIADAVTFGDRRRLRSWLLAMAVAIVGAQALQAGAITDLGKSLYLPPVLDWAGTVIGGLLFGYGMVLSSGCASKNLVRAGGGDLRAAVTLLVMGITAYAAIGGVLGPVRAEMARLTAVDLAPLGFTTQSLGHIAGQLGGIGTAAGAHAVAALLVTGLLVYCLADARFRQSPIHIVAGLGVGLCVVAGWAATGALHDELAIAPVMPASLTFVRPTGDSLEWLMRFTAAPVPNFAVALVAGTLLGAFGVARATGRFRLATFADVADTRRHLMGAVLMGFGGVMATGCTIGQAITGISTLSLGSLLAFAGILAGGVLGVKGLERSLS